MSKEALAEQPAQQEPRIGIYRSFEQWKSGNVLEHGVPRTEFYTKADLDLVEMGWRYGYDAGRAVEQALDKKAENAKSLGLDYGVEQDLRVFAQINAMKQRKALAEQPAQRPWVGLTDEEQTEIMSEAREFVSRGLLDLVEAALRSKNT
jgi:hypothetical protein